MYTADYYIQHLNLLPHPEGGYYKETYRSDGIIKPNGFDGERNISTAIYFLLQNDEKSHLHRIKSDELWFFHEGETLEVIVLFDNILNTHLLGRNLDQDEQYQLAVPSGAWFGSRIKNKSSFSLVSCTVAPGFDFRDFELAEYKKISREYPAYDVMLKDMCL